jgi:hypothetical protein
MMRKSRCGCRIIARCTWQPKFTASCPLEERHERRTHYSSSLSLLVPWIDDLQRFNLMQLRDGPIPTKANELILDLPNISS